MSFDPAATLVERACEFIRKKAIEFDLKPGERLNVGEIARELNMNRTPVREAMNRLVGEGLLTVVPNQGFSCRHLSATEILALYELRGDLETGALAKIRPEDLAEVLDDLEALSRSIRQGFESDDMESMVDLDEAFHLRLAALGKNEARLETLKHINAQIRFVRRINLGDPTRGRSLDEHDQIVKALRAGDRASAATLLRRHLTLSAEEAASSVKNGLAKIYSRAFI